MNDAILELSALFQAGLIPRGWRTRWTDDMSSALNRLWGERLKCAHIALAINQQFATRLTKNSIIGRANRMKLPPRNGVPRGRRMTHAARAWRAIEARERCVATVFPGAPTSSEGHKRFTAKRVALQAPSLAPDGMPVSILARSERQCSYIAGEARGPATIMCGAPVLRHSLCAFHVRLCWEPQKKKATNPAGTSRRSTLVPFIGEVPFS